MKVGVIKIGARISFSSQGTSGGTGEALSILKMLDKGGADIVVFTKILDKDVNPPHIEFRNILTNTNTDDLDSLVIINGTPQFYGGVEDRAQIYNYLIINQFTGKVFYIYCDPELTLKQIWPAIATKPWANNWHQGDLEITRNDIVYLSQPYDVEAVRKDLKKNEVIPKSITHFPFEKFPCLNPRLPINENPDVDLSYGGTMRGGKRIKKMVKFYFDHPSDISVEMFGKITTEDFHKATGIVNKPTFTGPIRYDEMLPKMNKSLAHIVIGDPYYEKINDVPQRQWESVRSSGVTFIDGDMDKNRRIWANDENLGDFLYVNDRTELSEKILLVKSDINLRKLIIQNQFDALNFNAQEYCSNFVKLLDH
jgi:hypothetical protein